MSKVGTLCSYVVIGPFNGDKLQGYPEDVYKIRIGSIDQKKGKQGGFRIIYIVVNLCEIIYLMDIYAKAQ